MIQALLNKARKTGEKKFAVLIDPDRVTRPHMERLISLAESAGVDFFLVGGSLVIDDRLDFCVQTIKQHSSIPVILFPGSTFQISFHADALLFLSLISGRNPELLIGKHVIAAPYLRKSQLEVLSTGYMLVDGGRPTTVSYISGTNPIPADKPEIAMSTALAGEMLGMRLLYLDAGSGAQHPISDEMIQAVCSQTNAPLIVGGGIRTPELAFAKAKAGADVTVVGNILEKDPALIKDLAQAIHAADKHQIPSSIDIDPKK